MAELTQKKINWIIKQKENKVSSSMKKALFDSLKRFFFK